MRNNIIHRIILLAIFILATCIQKIAAQYDVALVLQTINTTPVKYGTSVPFTVTTYNQSTDLPVQNIDIIVRTKNGFDFDPSINAIWSPDPIIPNA
jgi:hypothetical protein